MGSTSIGGDEVRAERKGFVESEAVKKQTQYPVRVQDLAVRVEG